MSHKKRALLEYLPYGINVLISGIAFLITACLHPDKTIERLSLRQLLVCESIYEFIIPTVCILPMLFSLVIMTKNIYLDIKMKKYDKKNGTKTYLAYYDESYKKNDNESTSAAFILSFAIAVIECLLFFFVKAIPNTTLSLIALGQFPLAIYMIFYGLFFYVTEHDMLLSDYPKENTVV